jgi:hypothetical protein
VLTRVKGSLIDQSEMQESPARRRGKAASFYRPAFSPSPRAFALHGMFGNFTFSSVSTENTRKFVNVCTKMTR